MGRVAHRNFAPKLQEPRCRGSLTCRKVCGKGRLMLRLARSRTACRIPDLGAVNPRVAGRGGALLHRPARPRPTPPGAWLVALTLLAACGFREHSEIPGDASDSEGDDGATRDGAVMSAGGRDAPGGHDIDAPAGADHLSPDGADGILDAPMAVDSLATAPDARGDGGQESSPVCAEATTRSCAMEGDLGNCAKGVETCTDGKWGACSISAEQKDRCDVPGES